MCGIFGVIRPGGVSDADEAVFRRIGDHLRHRGPDGDGFIREPSALLGMHRLSIMDVEHGWQPFWSEDGQVGVLGNGEIYNADYLRAALAAQGHSFTSHSDIEVVAHLYEEYREDCIRHLRGMFALVILDRERQQVVLARDRLGEKPLSYIHESGHLIFASEQTALAKSGAASLRLDPDVTRSYLLHGFTPEPVSIIEGVVKVPAAHTLRVSLTTGECSLSRYWSPWDSAGDRPLDVLTLASAIEDAVIAACTSDVPVAIALSGGLDSSMIAAIASKARPDLTAFTVSYTTSGFDESAAARELANHLGIACHTITLDTATVARDFAQVCAMRDEPISDIAGPALAALPRAARAAGVPVLLTGIGGDELFWGYEWVRHLAAWSTQYARSTRDGIPPAGVGFVPPPSTRQGLVAWATSLAGARTEHDLRRFMAQWSDASRQPLPLYEFQYGYRRVIQAIRELTGAGADFPAPEFYGSVEPQLKGVEYTVASNDTYLRVNSLTQVDRLSMHYSVESRTPLADYRLAETVLGSRINDPSVFEETKSRQREVAREILPASVVNRKKRGFTPPVRDWATAIWRHQAPLLTGELLIDLGHLDAAAVRQYLKRPVRRNGSVDQMALRLATLELWLRGLS